MVYCDTEFANLFLYQPHSVSTFDNFTEFCSMSNMDVCLCRELQRVKKTDFPLNNKASFVFPGVCCVGEP